MKFSRNLVNCVALLALYFLTTTCVFAELIFTAPPRENAARGQELYQPIADKLTKVLGEKVTYQQPTGWFDYTNKMRKGRYDIVFDGPHFAAWRVKHLNHTALVSLPGKLDFYLIARKNSSIAKPRQLVGKKICGLLSPNLGTDMVFEHFSNPVLQPVIHEVKGSMHAVYLAYMDGQCSAAIVRTSAYKSFSKLERNGLKILLKTRPVPNQTITVSEKLKNHTLKLSTFMTSNAGSQAAATLLTRYSKKRKYFVAVKNIDDYKVVEDIIEGVVYGW